MASGVPTRRGTCMDATFVQFGLNEKNPPDKWAYCSSLMFVHHGASILIKSGSVLAGTEY
jgi:hypothetical protein